MPNFVMSVSVGFVICHLVRKKERQTFPFSLSGRFRYCIAKVEEMPRASQDGESFAELGSAPTHGNEVNNQLSTSVPFEKKKQLFNITEKNRTALYGAVFFACLGSALTLAGGSLGLAQARRHGVTSFAKVTITAQFPMTLGFLVLPLLPTKVPFHLGL